MNILPSGEITRKTNETQNLTFQIITATQILGVYQLQNSRMDIKKADGYMAAVILQTSACPVGEEGGG